ncbi:MAG: hypothetical protein K0R38_7389 [Polyangiaceae bacterium]|nr:hypothetical protein [Polyangiaceae bacterium]
MKARFWPIVLTIAVAIPGCGDARAPSSNHDQQPQDAGSGLEDGEAGAGADAAPDCAAVEDEVGEVVTIRVVNATAGHLHLGEEEETHSPSLGWRFQLRDADGQPLAPVGSCLTCRDATVTGRGGCPSIALTQPALTLEPGEHADLLWDGAFNTNVPLPDSCVLPGPGPVHSAECRKATRAKAGEYTFAIRAGTTLDCGEDCQDCRARDEGGCETPSALVESLDLEARATVELESGAAYGLDGPIELVFRD